MGKIIGIDLGTTNSVVAVMEGGEPKVIANAEGGRTTPSIVAFKKDNERLVGAPAKRQAATNPKNTVYSIKRFMGRFFDEVSDEIQQVPYEVVRGESGVARVKVGDRMYTPQEISAMTLQKLKQTAESYLGEEVREAVITVPAYFNDAQRKATQEAGTIAGLKVRRIINEPTAAALAYGMDKKDKQDHKIAVYDFGGGTYDISILELGHTEEGESVFEVISTNGDTHLGGDNLDQELINYIADEFQKNEGVDLRKDPMSLQRLREAAENAKKELSTSTNTTINLPFITATQEGPKHLTMDISRSKFEQLVDHLLQRTIPPMKKALEDAGIAPSDVDEVLLVGGSTRIPKVREMVEQYFGRKPDGSVNPDEVVALGASIQGGVLNKEVSDILLVDVTPLNLGIETLGGVMTTLIDANTTIPMKKSEVFSTASDNQNTVDIHVLQGNRPMAVHNRSLGRFFLDGIPPAPRGIPQIEVQFDIDADGILHVSAKDKATGKDKSIRIEASSGLTEQEIEKMREAAKEHADEDRKQKEEIEKLNQADSLIFSSEKNLKEYGDKIPDEKKAKIESALERLREVHKNKQVGEIDSALEQLNQAWAEASEDMYKAQQEAAQTPPEQPNGSAEASDEGEVKDADYEVVDEG